MTRLFHILKLEPIFFNYYISLLRKRIVVESFTKYGKVSARTSNSNIFNA